MCVLYVRSVSAKQLNVCLWVLGIKPRVRVCVACALPLSYNPGPGFCVSLFCFLIHLLFTNEKSVRNIEKYNQLTSNF